eukprot:5384898-Pyramimonas_sp.AAC.1
MAMRNRLRQRRLDGCREIAHTYQAQVQCASKARSLLHGRGSSNHLVEKALASAFYLYRGLRKK